MKKKKDSYDLVVRILTTMEELTNKLRGEGKVLDEYQKAQVVQALVIAKRKLVQTIGGLSAKELGRLEDRLGKIEKEVDELVSEVDMEKVGEILTTLRLGMEKLVEKKVS